MIVIYIILIIDIVNQSYAILRCYSCQKEKQCGKTFLSNSMEKKIVYGNDFYDSCSITMNSNGLISRDLISSHNCRSSSSHFCCNQDLCNYLPLPPLPVFTTLSCAIGVCEINDNHQCNNSIIYLSSPIESCIRISRERIYMSYQIGCSPNNKSIFTDLVCCNSPLCNQQYLRLDIAIYCYTCDSRITGLDGCSILNTSSTNVYRSGSSSRSESCAMIVGLEGTDPITGGYYPAFTIRTIIDNCINQSFGNVTYGGAIFQGRIDCCSTSLCNIHPLYTNVTLHLTTINHNIHLPKLMVFITIVCLGIIFIFIGLSISIYRFYLNKSSNHDIPFVISDGTTVLFLPAK